jgi:hypothetical protein
LWGGGGGGGQLGRQLVVMVLWFSKPELTAIILCCRRLSHLHLELVSIELLHNAIAIKLPKYIFLRILGFLRWVPLFCLLLLRGQ